MAACIQGYGSAGEGAVNSGNGRLLALENFERNDLYGDPWGTAGPTERVRIPRPSGGQLGRPGPPSASGPHGLSPRLNITVGSSTDPQGQKLDPTAPYLDSEWCGPARSGEFADSGQSTRTGSSGRWWRTQAQRERLTDPGNGHGAGAGWLRG